MKQKKNLNLNFIKIIKKYIYIYYIIYIDKFIIDYDQFKNQKTQISKTK